VLNRPTHLIVKLIKTSIKTKMIHIIVTISYAFYKVTFTFLFK